MSKTIACIVTYNPDITLLQNNVEALINEVDKVVIIDNYSKNKDQVIESSKNWGAVFVGLSENFGIAYALNVGLDYAVSNGGDLLLTMDQDSYFNPGGVSILKKSMESDFEKTAIMSPLMYDVTSGFKENIKSSSQVVRTVITSGALCRVPLLTEVGGWDDKLFIDGVDFDLCYRLRLRGYKLKKLKYVELNHCLGNSQKRRLIANFLVTNHSSTRVYYQFRNQVYLIRKYYHAFPAEMLRLLLSSIKKFLSILLFETDIKLKIRKSFVGVIDGLKLK